MAINVCNDNTKDSSYFLGANYAIETRHEVGWGLHTVAENDYDKNRKYETEKEIKVMSGE